MRFLNSAKSFNKFFSIAATLMILPVAVACADQSAETLDSADVPADTTIPAEESDTDVTAPSAESGTIVEVATASGSLNTLVATIQAADLVETLNADGPYTVFAPTDEAFAALPEGVLDKLLLPENKQILGQVLSYHVIPDALDSSELTTGTVTNSEGQDLNIVSDGGSVTVNGVSVTQADVMASNGVIHVIDTVLLPPTLDLSTL